MKTDRLLKVTENMHKMGLKQLLISAPNSIFYLTGKFIHPGERMVVLSVLENGDVTLFANRLFAVGGIEGAKLIEYDDTDDCIGVLSEGVVSGNVGFDKEWAVRFALPLMERRTDIKASAARAQTFGLVHINVCNLRFLHAVRKRRNRFVNRLVVQAGA